MNFKITISQEAQHEAKQLNKKYRSFKADLTALVNILKGDPQQGEPLGKDCYKVRLAVTDERKGKSGGARVITSVKIVEETVFLLSIYDKSQTETITDKELERRLKSAGLL